ncbi:MAG TPA: hypothetical protein VIV60_15230, partial [Polyangiaceae bacterium]
MPTSKFTVPTFRPTAAAIVVGELLLHGLRSRWLPMLLKPSERRSSRFGAALSDAKVIASLFARRGDRAFKRILLS